MVVWTVVIAIILGIIGGVLGDRFNVASQLHLNINATLTSRGLISLAVTLVVMFVAAIAGGLMGVHYHKKIDRAVGAT